MTAAGTWRSLARRLGRAYQVVQRRADDGRWPTGVPTSPPWTELHVARLIAHQAELNDVVPECDPSKTPAAAGPVGELTLQQRARLKLTTERALFVELQRKVAAGELLDRAEVERGRLERIYAVKSELLALPRSVAAEFEGRVARRVELAINERVLAMLERFAGGRQEDNDDDDPGS